MVSAITPQSRKTWEAPRRLFEEVSRISLGSVELEWEENLLERGKSLNNGLVIEGRMVSLKNWEKASVGSQSHGLGLRWCRRGWDIKKGPDQAVCVSDTWSILIFILRQWEVSKGLKQETFCSETTMMTACGLCNSQRRSKRNRKMRDAQCGWRILKDSGEI